MYHIGRIFTALRLVVEINISLTKSFQIVQFVSALFQHKYVRSSEITTKIWLFFGSLGRISGFTNTLTTARLTFHLRTVRKDVQDA